MNQNKDQNVIDDFGREWETFDQSQKPESERLIEFETYFDIFPWENLPPDPVGFDAGCGSGRWSLLVAPRVKHLYCIEPSNAIEIARRNLHHLQNCSFHKVSIDEMPFDNDSMDFGYSLGVLHHIPDTEKGLTDCVKKLKPGAPFLLYIYYNFDNKPFWFKSIWKISDLIRKFISRLPFKLKYLLSQCFALFVYYPFARFSKLLETFNINVEHIPLSAYRNMSFYRMRTDALDRFGTKLEQRFSREQITDMMKRAGLENITFSPGVPYWCAVGTKKPG
ncbi:MAG: class I SAM-dependent methyltransferase [Balneolaceae bacterium]